MMTLTQALTAARGMIQVDVEMVNAVAFGPNSHDRYSGALISLALQHLDAMIGLLAPELKKWPSAFALSRVAADAAIRSVYLGFGDSAPNFTRRNKAFMEDKPNPFGGTKDLLGEIREAFNTHPPFVAWSDPNPEDEALILRHLEEDWGCLSSFTHSGEIQARLALHEVRTGGPPHENIRVMVIFSTTRVVSECVSIVRGQRGEPQRSGFIAIEFMKAFPPDQLADVLV